MRYFSKTQSGYTIIETMISISVFLVVVTIGMDSLLNASVVHQKSQDMSSIIDNLSFTMEDLARNIRTGYDYHCFVVGDTIPNTTADVVSNPKSCVGVGWAVAFESSTGLYSNDGIADAKDNDQWIYYIGQDTSLPDHPLALWKSTAGPYTTASFTKITSDEVKLDPASGFTVLGAEAPSTGDKQQPFITIRLVGKITYKNIITPFSLQTSISQRLVDR